MLRPGYSEIPQQRAGQRAKRLNSFDFVESDKGLCGPAGGGNCRPARHLRPAAGPGAALAPSNHARAPRIRRVHAKQGPSHEASPERPARPAEVARFVAERGGLGMSSSLQSIMASGLSGLVTAQTQLQVVSD